MWYYTFPKVLPSRFKKCFLNALILITQNQSQETTSIIHTLKPSVKLPFIQASEINKNLIQNSEPDSPRLYAKKKTSYLHTIIRLQSVYIKMTRGGLFRMLKTYTRPFLSTPLPENQCRGVVSTTVVLLLPGHESCVMGEQPLY